MCTSVKSIQYYNQNKQIGLLADRLIVVNKKLDKIKIDRQAISWDVKHWLIIALAYHFDIYTAIQAMFNIWLWIAKLIQTFRDNFLFDEIGPSAKKWH